MFHLLVEGGFLPFYEHRSLSFTCSLVAIDTRLTNLFNVKDAVPDGLRTRVVYKFRVQDEL